MCKILIINTLCNLHVPYMPMCLKKRPLCFYSLQREYETIKK